MIYLSLGISLFYSGTNNPLDTPERIITLCSNITKNMLSYHYRGISYCPTFTFHANKKSIKPETHTNLELLHSRITLSYQCSFAGGLYKSTRTLTYIIPEKIRKIDVTFSWDEEDRLIVKGDDTLLKAEKK